MSAKYYGKMWIATSTDLQNTILKEKVIQQLSPTQDRTKAHRIFASLYARYVILCNNLGNIYDQTLQVQKRKVVETILHSATQRLLELQTELKNIEMSEFVYIDDTLIEEKLIPTDVQLLRPFYYPYKRSLEIQTMIKNITSESVEEAKRKAQEESPIPDTVKKIQMFSEPPKVELSPEEIEEKRKNQIFVDAVNLIKRHEKARQYRILLLNIRQHPEIYLTLPKEAIVPYDFYHKEDEQMLMKIKRTTYSDNFEQKHISFDSFDFYRKPGTVKPITNEKLESEGENNAEDSTDEPDASQTDNLEADQIDSSEDLVKIEIKNTAARKIQNYWLRYRIKKLVKKREFNRLLCLGMVSERKWDFSISEEIEHTRNEHRNKKEEYDQVFIEVCQDSKARIMKLKSPWIMEDISDQIRYWFREMYEIGGEFDKYPPELKGGTILVVKGLTYTPEEFLEYIQKREADKLKSPAQLKLEAAAIQKQKDAAKEKRKQAKAKLKELKKQKKIQAEKKGKTWEFNEEEFITKTFIKLDQTMEEYEREWEFVDEIHNRYESPYMDWIELDSYAEVHAELRKVVDEFMRMEYEQLQMALCLDRKKKYKPPRQPRPRKASRRRKRKAKDPTADKTIDSLYTEMIENEIIMSYPKRKLADYIGDINYAAFELRNIHNQDPGHFMGEVTSILRAWILGLGPLNIKKAKSICIAGPIGCGKKFLAYALSTEIDAVMFNLSPEIVIKYADNIKYFVHLITKMARILQPVVLFLDGAHRPFIKKKSEKDVATNPTIIGNHLIKFVKGIKMPEKILLIGTTNEPWNSKLGKMKKCYEKIILCAGTDYSSTLLTWQTGVFNKYGVDRTMEFSQLAKVTINYPTGTILSNIDNVLDLKRKIRLQRRPLTHEELLDSLLAQPINTFPLTANDLEKYKKWFMKANILAKKRQAHLKRQQELKDKFQKK